MAIELRRVAALLAALLLAGCGGGALVSEAVPKEVEPPQLVIPSGVTSIQTPEQVVNKMRVQIAANERKLGRSLAPSRIIRIQLLRENEKLEFRHLDGSPAGGSISSDEGPGWVVEAIGTFTGHDPGTGQIDVLGTHGFYMWDDSGGERSGFIPCWSLHALAAKEMEGRCQGP